ncbi:hypothetical protein [Aggregatibacter kilianii]|uniref:hypothetical protein n=1 Tax=Aggregatibacter kilianii TaxID=2025884 RepID=UPI000D641D56|nr:hypothetical protein [Aggregatibacter kilianii]
MITLDKEEGIISIDAQNIFPYDSIEKVKNSLSHKLYNPIYGNNKENIFIFEDLESELIYMLEVNNRNELFKVTIEPQYLSWEDINNSQKSSIDKIKRLISSFHCKEENIFPWGKVIYQYDHINLIPYIEITYLH